jgi:hypothetical protein
MEGAFEERDQENEQLLKPPAEEPTKAEQGGVAAAEAAAVMTAVRDTLVIPPRPPYHRPRKACRGAAKCFDVMPLRQQDHGTGLRRQRPIPHYFRVWLPG